MPDIDFTRRLRKVMSKRGLSNKQLAHDSGLSDSTIGHLVSGKKGPSISSLRILKDTLRCTWEDLLGP